MYNLPYTVKNMVRGGSLRRCVVKYNQWPDGTSLNSGRIILVSV